MKMYDDQLIIITGGAGFIGSNVVKCLNERGLHNIVIFDDLGTSEKWKNLLGKKFIDILPKEACLKWLEGKEKRIEAFIHLGACTNTLETNANYLLENNYRFSIALAEYALLNNHRFIYASSAATYGDGSHGFVDDEHLLDTLRPMNMYGLSKHLFDLWLKNQGLLNQVVGLKYFNVFGPNENHKGRMASVIFHMVPQIRKHKVVKLFKSSDPTLYPDGGQMRDFIYVKEAAAKTCAFLENEATGIYNIGSGVATTWNDLMAYVFNALDEPVNIEYIPMPEDLRGKYQNFSQANMKKTDATLKMKDGMSLKASVQDYIQSYLIPGKFL